MKKTRRKFTGAFKASVALEAIRGKKTMAELSQQFDVNAVMISKWKTEFLEHMGSIFRTENLILKIQIHQKWISLCTNRPIES